MLTFSAVSRHLLFARQIRDKLLVMTGAHWRCRRRRCGAEAVRRRASLGNGAGMSERPFDDFDGAFGSRGRGAFFLGLSGSNVHRVTRPFFPLESQALGFRLAGERRRNRRLVGDEKRRRFVGFMAMRTRGQVFTGGGSDGRRRVDRNVSALRDVLGGEGGMVGM